MFAVPRLKVSVPVVKRLVLSIASIWLAIVAIEFLPKIPLLPAWAKLSQATVQKYVELMCSLAFIFLLEDGLRALVKSGLSLAQGSNDLKLPRLDKMTGAYAHNQAMNNVMTEAQRVESLNQPWKLLDLQKLRLGCKVPSSLSELDAILSSFKKVMVMGRFKVGKSQLMQWLGLKDAIPGTMHHTRGEVYLTDPQQWPNTIFVDTEGFEQSFNSSEPEFRKRLLTLHSQQSADAIILVMPQLMINDLSFFLKMLTMLPVSGVRLIVVHNLMYFNSVAEVREYREVFKSFFTDPMRPPRYDATNKDVLFSVHAGFNNENREVHHLFLGNNMKEEVAEHNRAMIRHISNTINNNTTSALGKPLFGSTLPALTSTCNYAYEFEPDSPELGPRSNSNSSSSSSSGQQLDVSIHKTEDKDEYEFKLNRRIRSQRQRDIDGQVVLAPQLDYIWLKPVYVRDKSGKMCYEFRPVQLSMAKIKPDTVKVSIDHGAQSLIVQFERIEVAWDDSNPNTQIITEIIPTDGLVNFGWQNILHGSIRHLKDSSELSFVVPFNASVITDPTLNGCEVVDITRIWPEADENIISQFQSVPKHGVKAANAHVEASPALPPAGKAVPSPQPSADCELDSDEDELHEEGL